MAASFSYDGIPDPTLGVWQTATSGKRSFSEVDCAFPNQTEPPYKLLRNIFDMNQVVGMPQDFDVAQNNKHVPSNHYPGSHGLSQDFNVAENNSSFTHHVPPNHSTGFHGLQQDFSVASNNSSFIPFDYSTLPNPGLHYDQSTSFGDFTEHVPNPPQPRLDRLARSFDRFLSGKTLYASSSRNGRGMLPPLRPKKVGKRAPRSGHQSIPEPMDINSLRLHQHADVQQAPITESNCEYMQSSDFGTSQLQPSRSTQQSYNHQLDVTAAQQNTPVLPQSDWSGSYLSQQEHDNGVGRQQLFGPCPTTLPQDIVPVTSQPPSERSFSSDTSSSDSSSHTSPETLLVDPEPLPDSFFTDLEFDFDGLEGIISQSHSQFENHNPNPCIPNSHNPSADEDIPVPSIELSPSLTVVVEEEESSSARPTPSNNPNSNSPSSENQPNKRRRPSQDEDPSLLSSLSNPEITTHEILHKYLPGDPEIFCRSNTTTNLLLYRVFVTGQWSVNEVLALIPESYWDARVSASEAMRERGLERPPPSKKKAKKRVGEGGEVEEQTKKRKKETREMVYLTPVELEKKRFRDRLYKRVSNLKGQMDME